MLKWLSVGLFAKVSDLRFVQKRYISASLIVLTIAAYFWTIISSIPPKNAFAATVSVRRSAPDSLFTEVLIRTESGLDITTWSPDEPGKLGIYLWMRSPPPSEFRLRVQKLLGRVLPQASTAKVTIKAERKETRPGMWTLTISQSISTNGLFDQSVTSWDDSQKQNFEDYFEMLLDSGTYELNKPIDLYREHVKDSIPKHGVRKWRDICLMVGSRSKMNKSLRRGR